MARATYGWQKLVTGNLSMGGNRVADVSLPASANDVTNKSYLNERLEKAIYNLNTYNNDIMAKFEQNVYRTALLIDGTMVPILHINWSGHRINNLADPSTQQYVDTNNYVDQDIVRKKISGKLPLKVPYVDGYKKYTK